MDAASASGASGSSVLQKKTFEVAPSGAVKPTNTTFGWSESANTTFTAGGDVPVVVPAAS
jgi:hypothetical protein